MALTKPAPERPELAALVERALTLPPMTPAQRRAQAVSWTYGNLMNSPHITREMVEEAYDALYEKP